MVLVHDTSSRRGLQVYQLLLKNLKLFSSYTADTKLYRKKSKGNNSKNTQARVMVLVHDTSTRPGLQVYQVSLKNL